MYTKFALCLAIAIALKSVEAQGSDPHCEEKEKSLAALDLAEDSLLKAKNLYPNCEDGDEISNSSECGKKDKSLGYIDVTLNLISEARKNIPVCPPPPKIDYIHRRPVDCGEVMENGHNTNGIYTVWPRSRVSAGKSIQVLCDLETAGGGWTVIQKRGNFSIQENFNRNWRDYKIGFGNLSRDFWIGNDNIYALSNQGDYSLRFDMMDVKGDWAYDLFRDFWIEDENANYTLHLGQHSGGDAGDSMAYHNGKMFSTFDRRNDKHTESCAILRQSGFWFHKCTHCNPNGLYQPDSKDNAKSIYYSSWRSMDGLFAFEMKLKRL